MKINYINKRKSLVNLSLILIMITMSGFANKKVNENDWVKDKLKGRVSSVTEFIYEAVENSDKIEKGERAKDYRFKSNFKSEYNKKGIKIIENQYQPNGDLWRKVIYKHDSNGNKIEEFWHKPDGSLQSKFVSKYNKANEIEKNLYNSDEVLVCKWIYKYDDNGNQIEGNSTYYLESSLGVKTTCKFDDKGNQIKSNWYNKDGSVVAGTMTFEYNANGKLISSNSVNNNGSYLNSETTYKYDDMGNQIEENISSTNASLRHKKIFKYTYDDKGNWVKKIFSDKYETFSKNYIIEREIKYYE